MRARQIFEYALVELNKRNAPSLLLEDYNYFINKAVLQYINKMYNAYDLNQQKTDDLRVLKSSAVLDPIINNDYGTSTLFNKVYEVNLPDDYLHILNCVVEYQVLKDHKCYNKGSFWHQGAQRLTADMFSQIINNFYLKPSYKLPYYYINNVNINNEFPTSDTREEVLKNHYKIAVTQSEVTIDSKVYITLIDDNNELSQIEITASLEDTASGISSKINVAVAGLSEVLDNTILIPSELVKEIHISGPGLYIFTDNIKVAKLNYGNTSKVRLEIRYGKDNQIFRLHKVFIDYLKSPQFIRLTQDQIDLVEDTSQILEFPDYICQEIINELVKLLMENASDPRLQTNIPVNQTIANPAQQDQSQQKR